MAMENKNRVDYLHRLLSAVGLLGLVLSLSSCMALHSGGHVGPDTWREEVLISDGRKLSVERSAFYGGRHEIGQASGLTESTITFTLPGFYGITWSSKPDPVINLTDFRILALHLEGEIPYVIATPLGCYSYGKWGRPNPPYVAFKYAQNDWQRITLEQVPPSFNKFNLLISFGRGDEVSKMQTQRGYISAEQIEKSNALGHRLELKTFLREPLEHGVGCMLPSDAGANIIAPEINGKRLDYNWWPLAQDWLEKRKSKAK